MNATPDSFSDGGRFAAEEAAVAHGLQLVADGADLVDVGGEATNPRAQPVDAAEELRRAIPVVRRLAAAGVRVSIDTTKAAVAEAAIAAGASIINDISGGLFDPAMHDVVTKSSVTYIAGHLRGRSIAEVFSAEAGRPPPDTLSWQAVAHELSTRIGHLPADRVWVDPGLGFGKGGDPETNLALIRHAGDLGRALGRPVVVGASRKRFLRRLLTGDPSELALDAASVAACLAAARAGAHVSRTHNVALLRPALTVYTRM
nr:dihydropteroate synthase [Kofleriaceae bacterium]